MCPHAAGTFLVCHPTGAAAGFLTPPAASLFLFSLTLRLALGFLFSLTLRLTLGFLFSLTLRLALGFLLASRLSASSLPFLCLLARNFLPRSFLGSHIDLHVGLSTGKYIQAFTKIPKHNDFNSVFCMTHVPLFEVGWTFFVPEILFLFAQLVDKLEKFYEM